MGDEFQFQNERSIKASRDGYITPSQFHTDLLLQLGKVYAQLCYLEDNGVDITEYEKTHDELLIEYHDCSDVLNINNDWKNSIAQLSMDVKQVYDETEARRHYLNAVENERVRQAHEKSKPTQRKTAKTYTKTKFLYKFGGLAGQIKRRRKSKENKRTATKRRRGRVGWRN